MLLTELDMAKKTIEQKYKSMSERQHILERSGMWVGSTRDESRQVFLYDSESGKMAMHEVTYVPAMLKLVDEVLSNSCDEYRRKDNMGLDEIIVDIDKDTNVISICDNGGIPVVKHKEAGMYVPEFIFGQLRTSSNYDDTEDRNVIGTNGVGSALTNVFSSEFKVTTADKKNMLEVVWDSNMERKSQPIVKKCNAHFTKTEFKLDFSRFDQRDANGLTDGFIAVLQKRCIDAAAANIGLKVVFNCDGMSFKWKFKKFEDYMSLYDDYFDWETVISMRDAKKQVWICPDCGIDVTFVNGAECSRGTHLKSIRIPVGKSISELLKKKHKIDVTVNNISNKYGIFGLFDISNPSYSSQTKEELTTSEDAFYKDGTKFTIPDEFMKKILKSEIVDVVIDWYKKKAEAEDQAKIRKLNREAKKLLRSDKFINCNSKNQRERTLIVFEGDSAGSAFRTCRNPMTQAAYFMRGVPENVYGMTATQVMKNQVFNDIVNIIGLQWGEYNKMENLKFSKIVIGSDMDPDGSHIAGLLMLFFNHFQELFEQKMICRLISPFIVANKGKRGTKQFESIAFNSLEEFKAMEKKLKGYEVKHVKGLGTLNKEESKEMYKNPIYHYFTKDEAADMVFKKWFSRDAEGAKIRKGMMKDTVMAEK